MVLAFWGSFVVACVTFLWGKMTLLNSCFHLRFERFDFVVVSFLVTCRKTLIVLLAVGATPLHELKPVRKNFTKKTSHKTAK